MFTEDQQALLLELQRAGILLFEQELIQTRYGLGSPVYLDLRENLYLRPDLMWQIGGEFVRKIGHLSKEEGAIQGVVGIPDTATPLALAAVLNSWQQRRENSWRFLLLRKEGKAYGSGPPSYLIGSRDCPRCEYNLIDDVMASGLSKWNAIQKLGKEGITVKRIVVFLDRQQGGSQLLQKEGHSVHAIFRLGEVLDFYLQEGTLSRSQHRQVCDFLKSHHYREPIW